VTVRYSPVGKYRTRQTYVWMYDRDVIDIFDRRGRHLAEAHREPDDRIVITRYPGRKLPPDGRDWLLARANIALPKADGTTGFKTRKEKPAKRPRAKSAARKKTASGSRKKQAGAAARRRPAKR
jgi:hypothetical protein